jgi:hypothetical protein
MSVTWGVQHRARGANPEGTPREETTKCGRRPTLHNLHCKKLVSSNGSKNKSGRALRNEGVCVCLCVQKFRK